MCCEKEDSGEGIFWMAILVASWKMAGMRHAGQHFGGQWMTQIYTADKANMTTQVCASAVTGTHSCRRLVFQARFLNS